MGFEYKVIPSERKILDKLTCDRCKEEIPKVAEGGWNPFGEPYSQFHEPLFNSYFHLLQHWGFSSNKDTQTHEVILCEKCYDIVFAEVSIKITNYM